MAPRWSLPVTTPRSPLDPAEAGHDLTEEPTAVTESGVVPRFRFDLRALARREEASPPSSTLPLSYRQSRSSGARVMMGITQNPWKKRA